MLRKRVFGMGVLGTAVALALVVAGQGSALAADGKAKPYLGILAEPTAQDAAHAGVVVRQVSPNSPAAQAGLKDGDVILKVGDQEVKDVEALTGAVTSHKAGDKLPLHVLRDGKEQDVTVTVAERPARRPGPLGELRPSKQPFLGVQTQTLTAELKAHFGTTVDQGVVVTEVVPRTPAAKAGLKTEDVITAVGDKAISKPEELREAIQKMEIGKEVTLKVARGKEMLEVKAKLEGMPMGFGALPQELQERFPGFAEHFSGRLPMLESGSRVPELEARIKELEKRIKELEQKQAK